MMNTYIAAGILEPLNRYTDNWDEWGTFTSEYIDMFKKDGSYYGLPYQVRPCCSVITKRCLKRGIAEPPATWDEAVEDAKKINNPDKQITGYATLAAEWTEWFFQYYVWQAGGDLTKENADGTAELTFTDPAVIEAAKYYQKLRSEGVLQSDLTLKFGDLVTNFGLGKIGMMPFAGDWVAEAAEKGIDPDDIGLKPSSGRTIRRTHHRDRRNLLCHQCQDRSGEIEDAAWEYISFYTSRAYLSSLL